MSHDDRCDHTEVHHLIIEISEEVAMGIMTSLEPMVRRGEMDPSSAGASSATMLFAIGLETGVRAALIDPIGAQHLLDLLDASSTVSGNELDEANEIVATDARRIMEAVARVAP